AHLLLDRGDLAGRRGHDAPGRLGHCLAVQRLDGSEGVERDAGHYRSSGSLVVFRSWAGPVGTRPHLSIAAPGPERTCGGRFFQGIASRTTDRTQRSDEQAEKLTATRGATGH